MKVKSDPGIDPAEVLDLLGASSWFGALPPELQSLIIDRSVVRKYRRNQVIVRQDEPTRGMFCVLRGRVRGVNRLSDGSEVLVHIGELGSWFAVYSMLANDVSIGSVVADCPVTTLNLPQPQFARIVRDEPSYYQYFARLLIEQFKMVFRYLGEVQGLEPEGLLLLRLRELVAVARRDRPGTPLANEIAVSQADLATMIGVSRQTLNVLLSRLERRGLVKIKFRRIQVIE